MSDPDEPATEAESDNAPTQPAEPAAAAEPAGAEQAEAVEPASGGPAKPARAKPPKAPRGPRKRRPIADSAAVVLRKARARRSRAPIAVGVAALAVIGVSAYAVQDRPGRRGVVATPNGPATGGSAPPATAANRIRVDPSKLTVSESGTLKTDRRSLRVVSALMDLTGKEQLAWAADNGRKVGDVRCTQNFRFNPREEAKVRPTMLMCWCTSTGKSVYAIAVDLDRRPSDKNLAKTIDKTWAALG